MSGRGSAEASPGIGTYRETKPGRGPPRGRSSRGRSAIDRTGEFQRADPAVPDDEDHPRVAEDEHDGADAGVPGLAEEPPGKPREDDTGDDDDHEQQSVGGEETVPALVRIRAVAAVYHVPESGPNEPEWLGSATRGVMALLVDRLADGMLVYRAVPEDDDHRRAYRRLLRYAFALEDGPDWEDDPYEQPAAFEARGLYEHPDDSDSTAGESTPSSTARSTPSATDGRPPDAGDLDPTSLVVCGGLFDFRIRVRDAWRPVGGVTAVASPPERRRRGHVGRLIEEMHAELRGRDVAFAALWPFSYPFYERFGYGRVGDRVLHEFPPSALDTPTATPADDEGAFRELTTDDIDALSRLYEAGAPEPLALRRSADWWRLRVFRSFSEERFVYGWTDSRGELRSYLAYHADSDEEDRRLIVDDWGAADDEAFRQLLAFLRNHDSQVSTVRLHASDASLLDRLSDPADADTSIKPGPMVRVIDVEAALSGLATAAAGAETDVVVRVRDARHDWNDGTFEVGVDDGLTTCRRLDEGDERSGGETGESGVTTQIGALSRLVVGARSARELSRLGSIDGDDDALARLDALLPRESPEPYLREHF